MVILNWSSWQLMISHPTLPSLGWSVALLTASLTWQISTHPSQLDPQISLLLLSEAPPWMSVVVLTIVLHNLFGDPLLLWWQPSSFLDPVLHVGWFNPGHKREGCATGVKAGQLVYVFSATVIAYTQTCDTKEVSEWKWNRFWVLLF